MKNLHWWRKKKKVNKKFILTGFIILIIVTAIGIYFYLQKNKESVYFYKTETTQHIKNFKIYLPSSAGLTTKEIYLKSETDLKNLERLIENFLRELPSPQKNTKILGVYRDKENTVYVDFSKDFASAQDARGEYFLVIAFYKTLGENFEWIKDIKILVESKEIETVAGHVSCEAI